MKKLRKWAQANKRSIIKWAIVAACFVLPAVSQIDESAQPAAFDPNSAAPNGTKAFVTLMRQAGADVNVGAAPSNGVALLLEDTLSKDESDRIYQWVQNGGTLVVADVASPLADSTAASPPNAQPEIIKPQCNAAVANGVGQIKPNSSADYTLFESDSSTSVSCFPVANGSFLSEHSEGGGRVIDIGSPDIFTNQDLAKLDNSILVTNLMQPGPGSQITWLSTQDEAGSSDGSGSGLSGLIPSRVKESLVQLLLAALFLALWRGRRLGAPVAEEQLVQIAGSQLVVAAGNLLQTANQAPYAADTLRRDLKRSLSQLLGVDPRADVNVLIQIAHQRTGIPRDRFEAVLVAMPAGNNTELITLAQQLEYLHMEVSRVR